jgi:pyrimidine-nucleoside phosphorylase
MRAYDIIYKKRQGLANTKEEIEFMINGYMDGSVADYQMSAYLMAICFSSMDENETFYLTDAMMRSGDLVDLSMFGNLSVDKHSTGGVGDKTSLIVAPIVASLGCKVAKMSGRGLGHTGGTVDKLESLSGYKSSLSSEDFLGQVESIGIAVTGQSGNLAPADKNLYALRDVTATVDCIPLIASSIMSKKLASGANTIVLDVKCGSGAFMKNPDDAKALAKAMIDIGKKFGRSVRALITNMDVPLGSFVGNALEVYEAVQALSGKGEKNLTEICVSLASNMVSCALDIDIEEAKCLVMDAISSGKALSKMKEWIKSQGGDTNPLENTDMLLSAKYKKEYKAKKSGYISKINAEYVGIASMLLGAGRAKKDDIIDYSAGIELKCKQGQYVNEGDTVCVLYSSNEDLFKGCENKLDDAFSYSDSSVACGNLIYDIL